MPEHPERASGTAIDARAALRARRRRGRAAFLRAFRSSPMGMAGLGILLFFTTVALLAPLLADPRGLEEAFATAPPLSDPTLQEPFGTDNFGRSVLTLTIWGSRTSLVVGMAAAAITALLGTSIGVTGGYLGGRTDSLLNSLSNWFLVIPWIPFAIALEAILGASLLNIIIVIGVTSWASTARLVRAQALSVKNRAYVERARAIGASEWRIVGRHVLPNLIPVVAASTVLAVSGAILSETTLALLGLGDPNTVSWGAVIEQAFANGAITTGAWWWLLPPGIGIVLVVLGFTMCGYALEEILNPHLRRRGGP
jgi:peptide/nickel transport system permease protein